MGEDLTSYFLSRAEAMVSKSNADPTRKAEVEAKAAAYELEVEERERRAIQRHRSRRQSEVELWREQRQRRLSEHRIRARADGLVEILPDPGQPPSADWFQDFLHQRVPNLRYSQCERIGHLALGMGAERLPHGHPNPAAYVLNYAKRVMKGEISQFVPEASIRGREHLLKMANQNPRFTENDPEAGELPPHMRSNLDEYAQAAKKHRPGPLMPIGDLVPRGTMPSYPTMGRQPGED